MRTLFQLDPVSQVQRVVDDSVNCQDGRLVVEAMPIVVIVAVIGKIPGNHSETLSAWGVLGLMAVAMFATRWLAQREISNTQRWVLGALLTVVALQIVGRLDLSESLRVWDFGWIGDLSEPDSDAFRKFGRVDHTIDGVLLFFVWFRNRAHQLG